MNYVTSGIEVLVRKSLCDIEIGERRFIIFAWDPIRATVPTSSNVS